MRRAVEYLAGLGHKRIAFLGWPPDSLSGNDRLCGYLDGMHSLDLRIETGVLIRSDYPDGEIDGILQSWQEAPPEIRPTAVIVVADSIAIAVLRAAERHGFRIGETLSVVGFDGVPIGQIIRPALTTLRQPMQDHLTGAARSFPRGCQRRRRRPNESFDQTRTCHPRIERTASS